MRKLFYYLGYLAFFGSGCFSTSSISDEHPEKEPTISVNQVKESFNQVKESFMEEISGRFNDARDLITGISSVIYNDNTEQRNAMLVGGSVALGACSVPIAIAHICHICFPPLFFVSVPIAGIAATVSIYKSREVTIGGAIGKGLAIGLITGTTSVQTNQLLGHLSHNSDHTTPVHLSPDHTAPVHLSPDTPVHLSPDHTTPVHHSGDSSLTPKSDAQAPEDSKGALNLNTAHGGQSVLDSSAESIVQNAHGEQSVFNSSAESIEKSAFIAKLENQFGKLFPSNRFLSTLLPPAISGVP